MRVKSVGMMVYVKADRGMVEGIESEGLLLIDNFLHLMLKGLTLRLRLEGLIGQRK